MEIIVSEKSLRTEPLRIRPGSRRRIWSSERTDCAASRGGRPPRLNPGGGELAAAGDAGDGTGFLAEQIAEHARRHATIERLKRCPIFSEMDVKNHVAIDNLTSVDREAGPGSGEGVRGAAAPTDDRSET